MEGVVCHCLHTSWVQAQSLLTLNVVVDPEIFFFTGGRGVSAIVYTRQPNSNSTQINASNSTITH